MRNAVSFVLFCAGAVVVSTSGLELSTVRVGMFVALTCEEHGPRGQAVLNATVEAAVSQTSRDSRLYRSNVSIEVDVVDACVTQDSVTRLTSVLQDSSSSYVAVAGPGVYRLCAIALALQRSRPVRDYKLDDSEHADDDARGVDSAVVTTPLSTPRASSSACSLSSMQFVTCVMFKRPVGL